MVVFGTYGNYGNPSLSGYVDGVLVGQATSEWGHISDISFSFIVPYGSTYKCQVTNGGGTYIVKWTELK